MVLEHLTAKDRLLHVRTLFMLSWVLDMPAIISDFFDQAFSPDLEYRCCEY